MQTKALELAQKLLELAKRGVGGEKTNAEKLLQKHMAKHGLSMQDIESEHKTMHWRPVERKDFDFFQQIASTVLGKKWKYGEYTDRNAHRQVGVTCTHAEWMEIDAKYDFYKKALKKEYDAFYYAFIIANNLFPKKTEGEESQKTSELTPEERAAWLKANSIAQNIDRAHFKKQIKQ